MNELVSCNQCGVRKPFTPDYFVKNKKRKCGLNKTCKECRNNVTRARTHSRGIKPKGTIPDKIVCRDCEEEKPSTREYYPYVSGRPLSRCLICTKELRRRKSRGEVVEKWKGCKEGDKFFYFTAVNWDSADKNGHKWLFSCVCGNKKVNYLKQVKSGAIQSCGCMRSVTISRNKTTHGLSDHPLYATWDNMLQRCYNPKHPEYIRYGGRGIVVCAEWKESPVAFISHMGDKPTKEHSIDRINYDGNYEPGNCRWATTAEQGINKRTTKTKNIVVEVGNISNEELKQWSTSKIKPILEKIFPSGIPHDLVFIDKLNDTAAIFNGSCV